MPAEFISPNWHVVLIHYPIALISLGLILEVVTSRWARESLRPAARWMLLFGAVLSLPTVASGLYAFRDAVRPEVANVQIMQWHQAVALSPWTSAQWEFIGWHIWLNSIASALFLLPTALWLGCSDQWRRRLYWPFFAAFVAGTALMVAGAWHGGEAVYRYGTAVRSSAHPSGTGSSDAQPATAAAEAAESASFWETFPPLQLHVFLAGSILAAAIPAMALTCRESRDLNEAARNEPRGFQADQADRRKLLWHTLSGRFWLLGYTLLLLTAVAGGWATMDRFNSAAWQSNWNLVTGNTRLLLHVIFGLSLLLLPIAALAACRHSAPKPRRMALGLTGTAMALLVFAQFWVGTMMLYDGHSGSVWRFNPPPPESQESQKSSGEAEAERDAQEPDAGRRKPQDQDDQGAKPQDPAEKGAGPAVTVGMTNRLKFQPESVTVQVGQTVKWINNSDVPHTVTADPELANDPTHVKLPKGAKTFNSGNMPSGAEYRHTFTVPGSYKYFCIPHEAAGMIATVEVKPVQ